MAAGGSFTQLNVPSYRVEQARKGRQVPVAAE
jgi:hypothetical protein